MDVKAAGERERIGMPMAKKAVCHFYISGRSGQPTKPISRCMLELAIGLATDSKKILAKGDIAVGIARKVNSTMAKRSTRSTKRVVCFMGGTGNPDKNLWVIENSK